MIYRTICTQLWTDKKVQRLTVQGKLLFVYLITNPHTHLSGIYYLPKELMMKETGLSNTVLDTLFHTLSEPSQNQAHYDPDSSTVFITNMFSYQGTGEKNERSAANQLRGLHETPLLTLFLERYPKVRAFCDDTLLDTVSTLSKRCPSVPNPVLLTSSPDLKSKTHSKKSNGHALETPIPDDWIPKASHQKLASARNLDLPIEAAHFRGKAEELNWVTKDWDRKFNNWMLQEIKFRQRRAS